MGQSAEPSQTPDCPLAVRLSMPIPAESGDFIDVSTVVSDVYYMRQVRFISKTFK